MNKALKQAIERNYAAIENWKHRQLNEKAQANHCDKHLLCGSALVKMDVT